MRNLFGICVFLVLGLSSTANAGSISKTIGEQRGVFKLTADGKTQCDKMAKYIDESKSRVALSNARGRVVR